MFEESPLITAPSSSMDLVRRDIFTGDPPVVLRCNNTGTPAPQTQWFFNGVSLRVSTGLQVTISNPQQLNSGIYQCFVSNGVVPASLENVTRTWILEITDPSMYIDRTLFRHYFLILQ